MFWPTSTARDESFWTAEYCPIFISGSFHKVISADVKRRRERKEWDGEERERNKDGLTDERGE